MAYTLWFMCSESDNNKGALGDKTTLFGRETKPLNFCNNAFPHQRGDGVPRLCGNISFKKGATKQQGFECLLILTRANPSCSEVDFMSMPTHAGSSLPRESSVVSICFYSSVGDSTQRSFLFSRSIVTLLMNGSHVQKAYLNHTKSSYYIMCSGNAEFVWISVLIF